MKKIKHFMLPEHFNKLYKREAISSISLTRDVTDKINELVDAYNILNDGWIAKEQEQDGHIRKAVLYMKDNLLNSIEKLLSLYLDDGTVANILSDIANTKVKTSYERVSGYVSITEFGAIGDGIQDDTESFQNAINYAIDNKKALYIPDGQFKVTSTLYLKDSINIYGDGESSQDIKKSTIKFDVGDNDIPLFTEAKGVTQVGRSTFNNVTFMRVRTLKDGFYTNELEYGKSGTCLGFFLNETTLNRCAIIGFNVVCKKASITDFIDCDIVYCNTIISNTVLCNMVSFTGGNIYACGTIIKANGNISTLNFTNTWIEDYKTLLETKGTSLLGINFTGCTLTNTVKGEDVFKVTETPVFAREFINFTECLLYIKNNICSDMPKTIEFGLTFDNSVVYYGGTGETIKIYGNSKFLTLAGANTDIISTNIGFDTKNCEAHSPIQLAQKEVEKPWQIAKPVNFVETKDDDLNRMLFLPVYYEFVKNPPLKRYFVFNTQAVSVGDWVLKFVYEADSGTIEKVIVTL